MPGDSSSAHLEERGFGDTRRFTARYAERMRDSRKLDDPSLAQPEDAGLGDTRELIIGAVGRARTGATRSGSAKGVEDARFEETR